MKIISSWVDDPEAVKTEEEREWQVGGRYVLQSEATLSVSPELDSAESHLFPKGIRVILLVRQKVKSLSGPSCLRGFIQDEDGRFGWCSFLSPDNCELLRRRPLFQCWEVGGRYAVSKDVYLGDDAPLQSDATGLLKPGDEVVLIAFALVVQPDGSSVHSCLRAQVNTRDGNIGWITCLTPDCKNELLSSENLFEADFQILSKMKTTVRSEAGFLNAITKGNDACPWMIGGQYRVLRDNLMRLDEQDCEAILGANEKVTVKSLCIVKGRMCADVMRASDGLMGTMDCDDAQGARILDTRDLLEYDKVIEKLQARKQSSKRIWMDDPEAVKTEEEREWEVGGRYFVQFDTTLTVSPEVGSEESHEFEKETQVILLVRQIVKRRSGEPCLRAFIQDDYGRSGWCSFVSPDGSEILRRRPLFASWQVGGRFAVSKDMLLRDDASLDSIVMGMLEVGEEVVLLAFALPALPDGGGSCLRAQVNTREGNIGWVSCLTPDCKNELLSSANLFEIDLQILKPTNTEDKSDGKYMNAITKHNDTTPWMIGGQYRVLQDNLMRLDESDCEAILGANEKVTVKSLCIVKGRMCADVMRASDGLMGTMDCEDAKGARILDTRDLLEYDKVMETRRDEVKKRRSGEDLPKTQAPTLQPVPQKQQNATSKVTNTDTQHTSARSADFALLVDAVNNEVIDPAKPNSKGKTNHDDRVIDDYGMDVRVQHADDQGKPFVQPAPPQKNDGFFWMRCCSGCSNPG